MSRYAAGWEWDASKERDWSGQFAHLQVLQDLRDELQAIRRLMECPNVQAALIAMQVMERRGRKKRKRKSP